MLRVLCVWYELIKPDFGVMEAHTQSLRLAQLRDIQQKAYELFDKKNRDYGDAFATYGTVGVLVRLQDKLHRAVSVSKKGVHIVQDETLRDTLLDLHNYAAMALMLLDE